MRNKSLLLKLGLMVSAIAGFSLSFTSAMIFHLHIDSQTVLSETEMTKNIMPIHFADNGNDFGGFFYFKSLSGVTTEPEESEPEEYQVKIVGRDDTYICNSKMRGYYYNAERGERLWPLDEKTESVWNITGSKTDGGLYTICAMAGYQEAKAACYADGATTRVEDCIAAVNRDYKADGDGYYGWIEHTFSGQTMVLVSGVEYERNTPFVTIKQTGDISPTFFRLENQYPVGFIYDHNGGVGLVGCKVKDNKVGDIIENLGDPVDLKEVFKLSDDKEKIEPKDDFVEYMDCTISDGNIVWDSRLGLIIEGVVGLSDEDKLGYIGNEKDDKMQYFSSANVNNKTLINYVKKKAEILCRGKWKSSISTPDEINCIEGDYAPPANGKTYIIKGNATIGANTSCYRSSSRNDDNNYYNVFVIGGDKNLIISEGNPGCVFSGDGFTTDINPNDFSGAVWNNRNNYQGGSGIAVGAYIKGNIVVDGHIKGTSDGDKLEHKYFVYGKLSSKDNFEELKTTFSWKCNNGIATDDTYCPDSLYQYASLVVIDQNYPSPFINS